jgi:shikimate kinase
MLTDSKSAATRFVLPKPVVLIGLMGAGKTSIGRQLAKTLKVPFVDSDVVLIEQAGVSIEEIFTRYGEPTFRQYERKIIAQLLDGQPKIVATGGGAFIQDDTRAVIREGGISVWLKATLPQLLNRTHSNTNRPLLQNGNRDEILEKLMIERYPIYAGADITIDSVDGPLAITAAAIISSLKAFLDG